MAIIDYGMGNLRSVERGVEAVGYKAEITNDPGKIKKAKAVILPGVGAFRDAIKQLEKTGCLEAIYEVIADGRPFLGICLGMQMLFSESEEGGTNKGLNILKGKVKRFPPDLKVPHMGWNQIQIKKDIPLLKGLSDGSFLYFVHSYYAEPLEEDTIVATTTYGVEFASIVSKGNIYTTQFHPEKSQTLGLKILRNFGELI